MASLPRLRVTSADPLDLEVDALVVPVFRGGIEAPGAEAALEALGYEEVPRDAGFRGKVGEVRVLAAPGLACGRVALVGLGRMDALDDEVLRRAAGAATRALRSEVRTLATTLPLVHPTEGSARATAEGALLGAYAYNSQRSNPEPVRLRSVTLVVPSRQERAAKKAMQRASVHAGAQNLARDLVNTPPGELSPDAFARAAVEHCGETCEVEVWDERRLAKERCGGLLAVGQGSSRPPRMVVIRYVPSSPVARVALVGKGITFDSGGLSLKRPNSAMEWMKVDMAGAAAVVATCSALADLDVGVEVLGVCALAENMPSENAQRPGDVITIRNGTTVEVLNTDAEGRLVLADALAYTAEQGVDAIVDLATLTGAALHAVGARATGAFSNDDDLLRQILHAAGEAGEATWHLPLWDELRENLDSEVADLNNLGEGDQAGATMAGLFLREFVDGNPWVHLDIAGAAWTNKERHYHGKQGTGAGVRTLLRWLEQASR